jgi:hypothetical protein
MSQHNALPGQYWGTADAAFETSPNAEAAIISLQVEKQPSAVLESGKKSIDVDDGRQVMVSWNTSSSIYQQYSSRQRWYILAVVSITSIIVPLTGRFFNKSAGSIGSVKIVKHYQHVTHLLTHKPSRHSYLVKCTQQPVKSCHLLLLPKSE